MDPRNTAKAKLRSHGYQLNMGNEGMGKIQIKLWFFKKRNVVPVIKM